MGGGEDVSKGIFDFVYESVIMILFLKLLHSLTAKQFILELYQITCA